MTDIGAQGRWRTLVLVYGIALGSMALIGILSPLTMRITASLGTPSAAIGLTISLFSLPSAIIAIFGGGVVDRLGPRRVLLLTSPLLIFADGILYLASNIWLFDVGVLLAGLAYLGILNGGVAMLIGALGGARRTKALALWATYAPVGFALGLLIAAPFTKAESWRGAILVHGAFMVLCALGSSLLPHVPPIKNNGGSVRQRLGVMMSGLRNRQVVMLGVAMAMPALISYGTSLTAPTYIAKVHGVSLAASASVVAVAKIIAVLLGGTVTGGLLARNVPPRRLLTIVVAIGVAAQIALFWPQSPLPVAIVGLMAWLFAYGAATGICMTVVPSLSGKTMGGGSVAGIVNQLVSIASFITPTLYFALNGWVDYVVLATVGMLVCLLFLPRVADGETSAAAADGQTAVSPPSTGSIAPVR